MDINAIKSRLSQLQNTSSTANAFWKPQPGKSQIRITPYNENKHNELICTYNVEKNRDLDFNAVPNTISLHRKKITNTLYTINALNELIMEINNGVLDTKFELPWDMYKNMILITNKEGLSRISTRILKIINI